jgi:multicomponent Na+:H+ antiporter subunit D
VLSLIYVFQIYQYDFWRGERTGPRSVRGEQAVVPVLAVAVLAAGIWPEPLLALPGMRLAR